VGDYGSSSDVKTFVIGINYPSFGCGRYSQHISFVDKVNSNSVGQIKEYGIRAIQQLNSSYEEVTSMSLMTYRIPYLVSIAGSVSTVSGVGVEGVTVSLCHIDPLTAVDDIDTNYCPLKQFTTDKRGLFSGEIRVSNPSFQNIIEYFNITASKSETLTDGTVIEHVFSPPSQIVSLQHLSQATPLDQPRS